jgi:general secretion pathway protein L
MSLLRIYVSLLDQPQHCQWALIEDGREPVAGQGRLADLPQRAERVQLLIPATQVLITRARIPHEARRDPGSALAFAVEEKMAGEPDASQVSWLGAVGDEDALAVIDKQGLERWRQELAAAGIRIDEVHCETLLLPVQAGEWSIAWNGSEGFVRTGKFEGTTTDCGDRNSPPLCIGLMLDEAKARGAGPKSIALYMTMPDAAPDVAAWQRELGTDLRLAGAWDWRMALPDAGICLTQQRQRWRVFSGAMARLRPAAWILGTALTLHAVALVTDWTLLAGDQRTMRQQMESQFRAAFPAAVAVVDPALQMRRKLAEARHSAGISDSGDFLPMIEQVAAAAKELPAGALRAMSYEGGQMTLEISANEESAAQRLKVHLLQSGLSVDTSPSSARAAGATLVLMVRAS